jgi:hypothetical protein
MHLKGTIPDSGSVDDKVAHRYEASLVEYGVAHSNEASLAEETRAF